MPRFIAVFIFVFAFLHIPASTAVGQTISTAPSKATCLCTPADFSARWHSADAVFSGTVQDIEVQEKRAHRGVSDVPVKITLLVANGYKNTKSGATFVLYDSLTRETCTGYPFELHGQYLVYAYMRRDSTREYWSMYDFPSATFGVGGLCGGTKPADSPAALADLVFIQKKMAAQKSTAMPDNTEKDSTGQDGAMPANSIPATAMPDPARQSGQTQENTAP